MKSCSQPLDWRVWPASGTIPDLHCIFFFTLIAKLYGLEFLPESLSHLSLSSLSAAKDVFNGVMQSKPSLLLKYCSPAHNRPGSIIINSLWWNISALYFVLLKFILSYFFGGENGFGVIFLEASWVCLLESFSPGNEACLSWAPVCSHTNELLIRMIKLLGEVKPSSWPKRRLWINLYKAEGSSKTPVQHSGANETCMSATRGGASMSCSFCWEIQSGGLLFCGI